MSKVRRLTGLVLAAATAFTLSTAQGAAQSTPVDNLIRAWAQSPHARIEAEAFAHWDEDGAVPERCAKCHAGLGYLDYLGVDGSEVGKVDAPAPIRSLIDCYTCHNAEASALHSVSFPSGATLVNLDSSARCMVCHQGRQSTVSVNAALEGLTDDEVNSELGFLNIHYRAAAASLYGGEVKGGYEYDGKTYLGKMRHPEGFDSCIECHSPHSTNVRETQCATCHKDVAMRDIRTSQNDADGDGDKTEGIRAEIIALHERLLVEIQAYATNVIEAPVAYNSHAYPYYFADTNGDGVSDGDEAAYPNRFQNWTPRLLRAAYNYQFVAKDPGAYSHNPHYALQILFDSIESLAEQNGSDISALSRP